MCLSLSSLFTLFWHSLQSIDFQSKVASFFHEYQVRHRNQVYSKGPNIRAEKMSLPMFCILLIIHLLPVPVYEHWKAKCGPPNTYYHAWGIVDA